LLQYSRKHSFSLLSAFASWYQRVLLVRGRDADAEARLQASEPAGIRGEPRFRSLTGLSQLAEALAQAGRATEGFAVLETAIEQSEPGCYTPELLRLKGELLLSQKPAAD